MAIRVRQNGQWVTIGGGGNSGNIETDTTLSKPGVPADAAATGTMIENLQKLYDESKITDIDFSSWESGEFIITYIDNESVIFQVEFDEQNQPTKITDDSGNIVTVHW